jgi:Tfp pilus assembly protein PilE
MKEKGFGFIGLLITVAIICLLVYGAFYVSSNGTKQNQLEQGQAAVDAAKNAANQENNYNATLQGGVDTGPGVNYRGVQQNAQEQLK